MPASFSEQLLRERDIRHRHAEERRRGEEEEKGMVNRIMLARMHTLEEGFREVLKEIKDLSRSTANSSRRDSEVEPMTPVRKLSLTDGKPRRSPKKHQRRGTKGKEIERTAIAVKMDDGGDASPKSVLQRSPVEDVGTGGSVERPGTAVRTPEPGRRSE